MNYLMNNVTENNKQKIISPLMNLIKELPDTSKYSSKEFSEIMKRILTSIVRRKYKKNKSKSI